MGLSDDPRIYRVTPDRTYLGVDAALDPSVIEDLIGALFAGDSKITIKEVVVSGTKESHDLTDGLNQLIVRCEKVTEIKYNFDEDEFDAGNKATITSGGFLKLEGLNFTGKTFYFEADRNNVDVEIIELY